MFNELQVTCTTTTAVAFPWYQVPGTRYLLTIYFIKKKNMSWEMDDFAETHLCMRTITGNHS